MLDVAIIQQVGNTNPFVVNSNFLLLPGGSPNGKVGSKKEPVAKEMFSLSDNFRRISLDRMDVVRLMNRFDSKYLFHVDNLQAILHQIRDHYRILAIDGKVVQSYKTVYFDTPSDFFYVSHHNGKLNRFKVRKRCYLETGTCFLEVKFKDNKGKMHKLRMPGSYPVNVLTVNELDFIREKTGGLFPDLSIKMENSFNRITLVNDDFNERCTIDFNLNFRNPLAEKSINELVVAELKHDRHKSTSFLENTFKMQRIYESSFSKYCIGRALLQPSIKKNRFKPILIKIDKQFKVISHE